MLAVIKGSLELMKSFLDRGADIENRDSIGLTPLLCAVQSGQLAAFYILLHRGANLNCKDNNGCNAIHWAAYKNEVSMLRVLKNMGMDLNSQDSSNLTGLHRASMSNALESIEYLLFSGASSEILDSKNRTALQIAKENESDGAYRTISEYSDDKEHVYHYFTYLFILYWAGVYLVYVKSVLPFTVYHLLPSLLFNFSMLWLVPLLM